MTRAHGQLMQFQRGCISECLAAFATHDSLSQPMCHVVRHEVLLEPECFTTNLARVIVLLCRMNEPLMPQEGALTREPYRTDLAVQRASMGLHVACKL